MTEAQAKADIVQLSEKASEQIAGLLEREQKDPNQFGLRLAVKGGGCSGLTYDLKFDELQEGDLIQNFSASTGEIKVFIHPKSSIYLKGMIVDFEDGLMGKGFVFKNPNASNTCGCGESFSVF